MNVDPPRTLTQNAKMWPMLRDFAKQVKWPHVTDTGEWVIDLMGEEDWKSVLTAGFEKETRMAQGWGGGTVMLGVSTSKYGIRRMAEFIDWLYAAGSEKDITWSERSLETVRLYGTALRRVA